MSPPRHPPQCWPIAVRLLVSFLILMGVAIAVGVCGQFFHWGPWRSSVTAGLGGVIVYFIAIRPILNWRTAREREWKGWYAGRRGPELISAGKVRAGRDGWSP